MKYNISAPNLSVICFDSGGEAGRLYHKYANEAITFQQYSELILELENLFDGIGYPQAALQTRRFDGKKEAPVGFSARQPKSVWSCEEMLSKRGKAATFVVHVKARQRATWQGECYWVEGDQKTFFVSELEFLKIIESGIPK